MTLRLDLTDARLLEALERNARVSNRALARSAHLSDSACLARVRRLEKAGIILGYDAAISFERLGAFEAWADVTLQNDEPKTIGAFQEIMSGLFEVRAGYLIGEQTVFRLHVATANLEGWRSFSNRLLAHRTVVKGVARALIYKSYRRSCASTRALFSV